MKPRGCCKTTPMYSENFSGMPRPFQWLSNRTRYNNSSRYSSTRGYILFKTDFRTGPERKAVGLDLYNILNNNTLLLVWKQSGMGGDLIGHVIRSKTLNESWSFEFKKTFLLLFVWQSILTMRFSGWQEHTLMGLSIRFFYVQGLVVHVTFLLWIALNWNAINWGHRHQATRPRLEC